MDTIIVTGGNVNVEFLKEYLSNNSYDTIIAVDKGLEALYLLNILPDHIVGDFDSVSNHILHFYTNKNVIVHQYNSEKDYTDTDIALKLAMELNSTNITILGATGTRIDHILANIHILLQTLDKNIHCSIIDEYNKIYLINSNTTLKKNLSFGKYVSLIPLTTTVTGVTLKGFKYLIENYTLEIGQSLGISNEINEDIATIELKQGCLIVIESKD